MLDINDCQPYVRHMLAEHRRLHKLLQAAGNVVRKPSVNWSTQLCPLLIELRQELEHHFLQEEQGGCLEQAASYCPSLSADVRRIEAEHPRLLAKLKALIEQTASGRSSERDRQALEHAFASLSRDLYAHEAAEIESLRRGFGINVNDDEVGVAIAATSPLA